MALSTTLNLLTQIPHLVILVREYARRKESTSCFAEVINLMQSLYETGSQVEARVDSLGTALPTQYWSIVDLLPWSYTFRSTYHFDLALHYFTYRVLLCGLIQSFWNARLPTSAASVFDIPAVRMEEENNTRKITMCIEYAMNRSNDAPCVALRLLMPLKHAYGAWDRIQLRKAGGEGMFLRESLHASRLKNFCLQSCCDAMQLWGATVPPPEDYFRAISQTHMGGPLWRIEQFFD